MVVVSHKDDAWVFWRNKRCHMCKRCREENRPKVELDTKAWEPALHARTRQVVRRGELGT